jgi:D-alanine-D-alanine ligase
MRVLLIAGGWSSEREVSLSGARQIEAALKRLGHRVTFFDPSFEFAGLIPAARAQDFAFLNLHGQPGEDGLIQALLERAGCPYQGSGPTSSFLALNKAAAKCVFEAANIPTPRWELTAGKPVSGRPIALPLPVFVKPNMGGSSVGMSLVRDEQDLLPALEQVFGMGEAALVEEYLPGVELTCGVLGERPLPLVLIRPRAGEFFDYRSKYAAGGAEEVCPAPVDAALTEEVQRLALAAHEALGLYGYSRADFMVREGRPYLLEVNTLPGMTPTSLLPQAAQAAGLSFDDLVAELIRIGLERPR